MTQENVYVLCHHGIKGMKWGVRRFQKKDGSLTSAGKKRYDDSPASIKKKSKHRLKLEERYKLQGMTQKDAEAAANKRIKIEKALAIASAMTITAATAYVVRKKIKENSDGLIKEGMSMQRIERFNSDGKLHNNFYAALNKADKTKYAGMLGQGGESQLIDIRAKKDIKIAGNKTALKTFEKLLKEDEEFKREIKLPIVGLGNKNVHGGNRANGNIKKMYENFNTNLIDRDNPAVQKFYDALSKQGYGAVRDINDMKFSGYKAKNPLILFNSTNNVMKQSVRSLSQDEANSKMLKAAGRSAAESLAKLTAVGVPIASAKIYMNDHTYTYDRVDEYINQSVKKKQ